MWLVFHDEGTSLHSLMYSAKAPSDQSAATSATVCKEQDAAPDQPNQATTAGKEQDVAADQPNQATTAADQDTTAAGWQSVGNPQSGVKQQGAKHARPKDNGMKQSRQASHDQDQDSQVASLVCAISKSTAKMLMLDFAQVHQQCGET